MKLSSDFFESNKFSKSQLIQAFFDIVHYNVVSEFKIVCPEEAPQSKQAFCPQVSYRAVSIAQTWLV